MQSLAAKKSSALWILLIFYLFFCSFVFLSLSVPPADFPFCIMMFIIAVVGLAIAWQESRVWRLIWMGALVASIMCGSLELIAGHRIANQLSRDALSIRHSDSTPAQTPGQKP
jgi:hypothetical protein